MSLKTKDLHMEPFFGGTIHKVTTSEQGHPGPLIVMPIQAVFYMIDIMKKNGVKVSMCTLFKRGLKKSGSTFLFDNKIVIFDTTRISINSILPM